MQGHPRPARGTQSISVSLIDYDPMDILRGAHEGDGMSIRRTITEGRHTGGPYDDYRLVESVREGERVHRHRPLNLGLYFEVPRAQRAALVRPLEHLVGGRADCVDVSMKLLTRLPNSGQHPEGHRRPESAQVARGTRTGQGPDPLRPRASLPRTGARFKRPVLGVNPNGERPRSADPLAHLGRDHGSVDPWGE